MLESVERETGTDGGHPDRRDRAVEPVRPLASLDLTTNEQHDGGQGDREEPEVERVGQRRVRGCCSAQRLDRQHQIAGRPREAGGAQRERHPTMAPVAEAPREAQRAGDQLEGDDKPAVEPRRELLRTTEDQEAEVGDEQDAHQTKRRPDPPPRPLA